MDDEEYPYFFEELADDEKAEVKEHFLDGSLCSDLVRVVDRKSNFLSIFTVFIFNLDKILLKIKFPTMNI